MSVYVCVCARVRNRQHVRASSSRLRGVCPPNQSWTHLGTTLVAWPQKSEFRVAELHCCTVA
eukprot:1160501-Pelagomonas_calceolata.AAC.2